MTDKEITKALECCIKSSNFGECFENKCPFVSENGCKVGKETLYPYVLDLINRQQEELEYLRGEREVILEDMQVRNNQIIEQQAEIEKLNVELVGMRGACNSYKMHYDNAKVEIERLEKELSTANNHITRLESQIERLLPMLKTKRAEAIKEFADRLKEKFNDSYVEPMTGRFVKMVDNLVKEMVGEGK